MVGKIIALISLIMCAIPFFIIASFDKNSRTPITFWAGDNTLKDKVKNIEGYNKEMAGLYYKCGIAFIIDGVVICVSPVVGTILLVLICSLGIYLVYREYMKILRRYS